MNVRRILVGLDGSPREPFVLAAAQDLAVEFDAALHLLRAVVIPPEVPSEAWQCNDRSLLDYLEEQAVESLKRCSVAVTELVQRRLSWEVVVAAPWQALCLSAQAQGADLIVVGSHGYGALDRMLGTTAARVVNHAPCSVFVVRTPELSTDSEAQPTNN